MLKYKIIPIFKGEVIDGKFKMADEDYSRYVKWLLSHSGKYQFIIKKVFRKRSIPQNSYYWGVVLPMIAKEMGEDDLNEAHALMKAKFLSKEKVIAGKNGWEKVTIVGKSSKLSTHDFGIFLEKVIRWASSFLELHIPDPDPEYNSQPIMIEDD